MKTIVHWNLKPILRLLSETLNLLMRATGDTLSQSGGIKSVLACSHRVEIVTQFSLAFNHGKKKFSHNFQFIFSHSTSPGARGS